ncbi:MAG: universal stress protein [Rhodospirillales bacterium]|jgi:nucleotide-binding universal stress UspA family protein
MAEINISEEERKRREQIFRMMVCFDGSEESFRALRYAAGLSHQLNADLVVLFVRAVYDGASKDEVYKWAAEESMLDWDLDLAGLKFLRMARDVLVEMGELADDWRMVTVHTDVDSDVLGDNKIEYINDTQGREIVMKLKVSDDIARGILDQYELGPYDLIVLGASELWQERKRKPFRDPAVAEKVAIHAPCSVLVTRKVIRTGHGHLLCTDGSDAAMKMIRKEGELAAKAGFPVSVLSVALDHVEERDAQKNIESATAVLKSVGAEIENTYVRTGSPIEEIIDVGKNYSLIAVSASSKTGLQRFFLGSVSFQVLEQAENSVMLVR